MLPTDGTLRTGTAAHLDEGAFLRYEAAEDFAAGSPNCFRAVEMTELICVI
jgi:hypothetical protein